MSAGGRYLGSLRGCVGSSQRQAAAGNEAGEPFHRLPRALGHDARRQLLVIVVEDLEAVVAAVAHIVEAAQESRYFRAVHALAREDAVVARSVEPLGRRGRLLP